MQTCPPNTVAYTIKAGDTFYALARMYNTTTAAIIAANPSVNPNALMIGQQICIPKQTTYPPCTSGNYYTIRQGDTLYAIAARYNVTYNALVAANPGIMPTNLMVGTVICIPTPTPVTCPGGSKAYTVMAGDTLYSIAARYNITVDAIMRLNPSLDPNSLLIGQVICLPVSPSTCPVGTTAYTIKAGDTLNDLAKKYNTTVDAIVKANPGIDPYRLMIGQVICLPGSAPATCPAGSTAYTIKAGDTLSALAKKYNTTVAAIEKANPGIVPTKLKIGQVICIP
jgi:LysM repeat protein